MLSILSLMASLGSILVTLDANIRGFDRGLSQAGQALNRFGAQTRASLADIDKAFSTLGTMAAGVGAAVGGALLVAANRAAEAERNLKVLQVVADKNNVSFVELSAALDQVAGQFGLTGRQAQGAATTLIRSGATLEQTAALLQAAGASALLAGFDVQTAWDNVATAVVTGRSELLETSGIISNLGPAQQAYAQSVGKTVEELTQQERIQANTAAILSETRTEVELIGTATAGYTGEVAKLRAGLDELVVAIGQQVLPKLTQVVGRLNEFMVVARNLDPETQAMAVNVGEVTAIAGGLAGALLAAKAGISAFGGAIGSLGKGLLTLLRNPITALLAGLAELAKGFLATSSVSIPWLDILARVGDALIGTAQATLGLVQTLMTLLQAIGQVVGGGFTALVESIQALPQGLGVVEAWAGAIAQIFAELMAGVGSFGQSLKQVMTGDLVAAGQTALAGVQQLGQLVNGGLAQITETARQSGQRFADAAITEPWSHALDNVDITGIGLMLDEAGQTLASGGARIRLAFDTSITSPLASSITSLTETSKQKFAQMRASLEAALAQARAPVAGLKTETDYLNLTLGETPAKAVTAGAAIASAGTQANTAVSEFERLSAAAAALGSNLPTGLGKLSEDLGRAGVSSSATAAAIADLTIKAGQGSNALDQFDQQIIEVGQALASGLINPSQADELIGKLRQMQEETQGIAAAEKRRNELLEEQKRQNQEGLRVAQKGRQEAEDGLRRLAQLQGEVNNLVAEQNEKHKGVGGSIGRNNQLLTAGDKYLKQQNEKTAKLKGEIDKVSGTAPLAAHKMKKELEGAEKEAKKIAKDLDNAQIAAGLAGRKGRTVTYIPGGYQTPMQDSVKAAAKSGLGEGLREGAKGGDWESALNNTLSKAITDAVINGMAEALVTSGPLKQITQTLASSLSSQMQVALDNVGNVNRGSTFGGGGPPAGGWGGSTSLNTNSMAWASSTGIAEQAPFQLNWLTQMPNRPVNPIAQQAAQGGSVGVDGRYTFSPLEGAGPEDIAEFFAKFKEGAGKAIEQLKPIFGELSKFFADDAEQKIRDGLRSGIASSVGSAMSAALQGGNWRMALQQSLYTSVINGLTESLNEQLASRYSRVIERVTEAIMVGSASAASAAFGQVDRLVSSLTGRLAGVMGVIEARGERMRAAEEQRQQRENLQNTIAGGLQGGITAFLEGKSTWQGDLKESFRQALLQGMVEAILNKGIVEGLLAPVVDGIGAAITAGNMAAAADLVTQFMGQTLPQVEATIGEVLAPLYGVLAAPEAANVTPEAANAAGLQLDLSGPQYQGPAVSTTATDQQLEASETFSAAVESFQTVVNGLSAATGQTPATVAQPVRPGAPAVVGTPKVGAGASEGLERPVEDFAVAVGEFTRSVRQLGRPAIPQAPTVPNRSLV